MKAQVLCIVDYLIVRAYTQHIPRPSTGARPVVVGTTKAWHSVRNSRVWRHKCHFRDHPSCRSRVRPQNVDCGVIQDTVMTARINPVNVAVPHFSPFSTSISARPKQEWPSFPCYPIFPALRPSHDTIHHHHNTGQHEKPRPYRPTFQLLETATPRRCHIQHFPACSRLFLEGNM